MYVRIICTKVIFATIHLFIPQFDEQCEILTHWSDSFFVRISPHKRAFEPDNTCDSRFDRLNVF